MRTARSSTRLLGGGECLPQCVLGYSPPLGCGPGDPLARPHNLPPWVWAWRQNSWHTLLKILPCPNLVAGSKNVFLQLNCSFPVSAGGSSWFLPGGVFLISSWGCLPVFFLGRGLPGFFLGVCLARGVSTQGGVVCPGGVPCDLSHHAFDVTCMLPPHQLRPTNSAAAYILLVGHETCKACWDTTSPPPYGQNSWDTLLKILPCPNFVAGSKNWVPYFLAKILTNILIENILLENRITG